LTSNEGWTCWVEDVDTNYTFNGTNWVEFGSTVSHNNTTGLQGGTSSEYYHLTSTEHTDVPLNTSYRGVGHLPLAGGTVTGILATVGTQTITNAGTGNGLLIDQNGNGQGIRVQNAGTEDAVQIEQDGVLGAYEYALHVISDAVQVNSGSLVYFSQTNASSSLPILALGNQGTGTALSIGQVGIGYAIDVAHTPSTSWAVRVATNGYGMQIINSGTHEGIFIDQNGATANEGALSIENTGNSGTAIRVYSNQGAGQTDALISFVATSNDFDQEVIEINNDGTGPSIAFQQEQDVEVIDFDACTDGGTSHTTVAGSVKVQMPNGSTGYINVYT
jgi:hypothetical protein